MAETPSLLNLVFGYAPAQIIHVAARLGIADHLAHGPRTSTELAAATGAHAPSLLRLLRALTCYGVVSQVDANRFELTPLGMPLRSDAPDSIRSRVLLHCMERSWPAWGELEHGIRTGTNPSATPMFEYLAQRPEQSATFNAVMADQTREVVPELIEHYDFSRFDTLVDVGGGNGALLAALLTAVPHPRGVLFDLPAGLAEAPAVLRDADVADRCRVVSGDFFDSVPPDADAYLVKSVLHDWDDDRAVVILRNCRTAMAAGGVVLVIEPVVPERVSPMDMSTVMCDLNVLVATGGQARTEAEFRALYAAAGLELTELIGPLGSHSHFVIVGRPPRRGGW